MLGSRGSVWISALFVFEPHKDEMDAMGATGAVRWRSTGSEPCLCAHAVQMTEHILFNICVVSYVGGPCTRL